MIRLVIVLMVAAMLAGCPAAVKPADPPPVVQMPATVTKVVKQYVPVPGELTRDCHDEPAAAQTNAEALRLALVRRASLAECTARMRRIRALGEAAP